MICPHCHCDNRDGAKFCNECGRPLTGPAAEAVEDAFAFEEPEVSEDRALDEEQGAEDPAEEEGFDVEPEGSPRAGASGPLDPDSLPSIDVVGVNVAEDGSAFDPDDAAEAPAAQGDVDPAPSAYATRPAAGSDPDRTADLSGLDECLVDSSYVPPKASWRSGDTMEMPRIEGASEPRQKDYRAPDPNKKKGGKAKVAVIVIACLLVAAGAAAAATYQMELWGGKMLPDVVGMTQTDAAAVLEEKGFSVRSTEVVSDELEGVVLLMDPGAISRQSEGTEVVVHVSVSRTVPNVVGRQRDESAAQLEDAGFENVSFATEKSDEREGTVLAVSPEAGAKAQAATPVTLTVAVPYTVPDIAGMSWDDAVAALEAEGLVVASAYVYDDSVADGTLLGTNPAAGEKVASGSTVTINISRARGAELEAAAWTYLQSVGTLTLGGTVYEVQSVDGVSYQGNETTAFTITGAAVTTLDGETVRTSARQKNGVIVWDAANNIVSVS